MSYCIGWFERTMIIGGSMTKRDMEVDVTYIICPKRSCKLFRDITRHCACDGHCPFQKKQRLAIVCQSCGEIVMLDGGHCAFCRVDHCCSNGYIASNFGRMSGVYHLLYKIPQV